MTEHHGLDLEAIQRANGGHSIFAPSSSHMILTCAGALLANLGEPDNAGFDAAEGTVGHEVADLWLTQFYRNREDAAHPTPTQQYPDFEDLDEEIDYARPVHLIGTVKRIVERVDDDGNELLAFDVPIKEEMLGFVRQYVKWCVELPGVHYTERRVDISKITPIPNQGGTADHAACEPGVLTISDLKYGKGIRVDAAEDLTNPKAMVLGRDSPFNGNTQAMNYALGFFWEFDHIYHFEKIVIRIAQPRKDHWQVWETNREELLAFARYAKIRYADAWVPNAPRTPSKKGCQFCRVQPKCAAYAVWYDEQNDGVFDPVTDVIEGSFRDVTAERALEVREKIDRGALEQKSLPKPFELTTDQMARILVMRKTTEKWFAAIEQELEFRAKQGEKILWHKLVDGRLGDRKWIDEEAALAELEFIGVDPEEAAPPSLGSPAQIEEILRSKYGMTKKNAEALIASLVSRAPGRPTLALDTDSREALDDLGSVFDVVEDDL